MPLSEYEQRVLEQLERDLGADPKMGRAMTQAPRQRARVALGVVGVLVGLSVVLVGAISNIIPVGIAGFALMIAAAMWVIFTPKTPHLTAVKSGNAPAPTKRRKESFMRRVENRLERRRESGDF